MPKKLKTHFVTESLIIFFVLLLWSESASDFHFISYCRLIQDYSTINAAVTDTKLDESNIEINPGTSNMYKNTVKVVNGYYVKYQFSINNRLSQITSDRWYNIPYYKWQSVSKNKQIEVVFSTMNPAINVPKIVFTQYLRNLISKILLSIVCSIIASGISIFISYFASKK